MPNKEKTLEANSYTTITVDIPYELKDKLKFLSYTDKQPIKEIVKAALEMYFKKIESR